MKIYVLDKQERNQELNRDWLNIIPAPFSPVVLKSYDKLEPARDDLVIIHLSNFRSDNGSIDIALAQKLQTAGCLRLFIAGSDAGKQQISSDKRGCVRCAPVSYPTDPVFSSRLALFLDRLSVLPPGTNPPWELVEPPAIPEHLVAIYLLSLATAHNQKIDFMHFSKELDEAKVEFKALGGTNETFLASDMNSFTEIAIRPDVRDAIGRVLQSN